MSHSAFEKENKRLQTNSDLMMQTLDSYSEYVAEQLSYVDRRSSNGHQIAQNIMCDYTRTLDEFVPAIQKLNKHEQSLNFSSFIVMNLTLALKYQQYWRFKGDEADLQIIHKYFQWIISDPPSYLQGENAQINQLLIFQHVSNLKLDPNINEDQQIEVDPFDLLFGKLQHCIHASKEENEQSQKFWQLIKNRVN